MVFADSICCWINALPMTSCYLSGEDGSGTLTGCVPMRRFHIGKNKRTCCIRLKAAESKNTWRHSMSDPPPLPPRFTLKSNHFPGRTMTNTYEASRFSHEIRTKAQNKQKKTCDSSSNRHNRRRYRTCAQTQTVL